MAPSPSRDYNDWFGLDPAPGPIGWWQDLRAGFTVVGRAIGNVQGYILLTVIYFTAIMLTRLATALVGVHLLDKSKPGAESYYVPRAPQDTSLDEMSIQS